VVSDSIHKFLWQVAVLGWGRDFIQMGLVVVLGMEDEGDQAFSMGEYATEDIPMVILIFPVS
jgi:hypothetical protein